MYVYAILAIVFVLGPAAGLWPPVIRGERREGSLFLVTMREPSWYEIRGRCYRAVVAKEVAEWWLRWAVAFPLAAPTLLLQAYPYQWIISLGAVLLASLWSVLLQEQLLLLGCAVEVVADGRAGYLEASASRLRENGRWMHAGISVVQLEDRLRRRLPAALFLYGVVRRRVDAVAGPG